MRLSTLCNEASSNASHPPKENTLKVLSIDPGDSTGIVVLEFTQSALSYLGKKWNELTYQVTVQQHATPDVDHALQVAREYFVSFDVDLVVIEEPPVLQSQAGQPLKALLDALRNDYPGAAWVRPAQWKASRFGSITPAEIGFGTTTHERDAYSMARWRVHYHEVVR